jgi:thiamine kinase-like enzyme
MPEATGTTDAVSPKWLSDTLRRCGVLPRGRVVGLQQREGSAFNSRVVHLRVQYSADAPNGSPSALLLKRMDRGWGEREVAFYQRVRAEKAGALPMLVPCYHADMDERTGSSLLLLDDVSSTHREAVSRRALLTHRGVPAPRDIDQIMISLARFHAHWWEHPALGQAEPMLVRTWYRDQPHFKAHVARREREWTAFANDVGAGFPDELRRLYEEALDRLPALWRHLSRRVDSMSGMTLSHGDCYLTQWLCPRGDAGQVYLIDFDSVSANLGAFDLVYLMATFWTREQRRAHEERCLQQYHQALRSAGVAGYGWDELIADVRLMTAFIVWDPVFDQTNGSPRDYWWPKMTCLVDAYRGWRCEEL